MGIFLKFLLLCFGAAATFTALYGDTINAERTPENNLLSKLNARGRVALGLLVAALFIGTIDLWLSERAENGKLRSLSEIANDLDLVSTKQQDQLREAQDANRTLKDNSERTQSNLETTQAILAQTESASESLHQLPLVIATGVQPFESPATTLKSVELRQGDVVQFSLNSSTGVSEKDVREWEPTIQIGRNNFPFLNPTGEIVAGSGDKQKVLVRGIEGNGITIHFTIFRVGGLD